MTQEDEEEPENPFTLDQKEQKQEELKEEVLKQHNISFKGFDKYAKFVEFEEKLFESDKHRGEEQMFAKEGRYKAA